MINIQELTKEDIKRKVVYKACKGATPEEGIITSYNNHWVFVDFQNVGRGVATPASSLEFV